MNTNEFQEETQQEKLLHQADLIVRENPIPAVLATAALGFGLGLLIRALRPEPHPVRDFIDEKSGYIGSLMHPLAQGARKAYSSSSHVVRDAVDRIQDFDVKPSFWQRLWS
ncbi:MAG: hypothetical protein JWL59_4053 [Chthoniobacteraceae bacterium]|nr:hypothetical protein [Chthoniobacteraceae bacterium]